MDDSKFIKEINSVYEEEIEREIDEENLKFIKGSALPQIEPKNVNYDEITGNIDEFKS